jgi:hypothetical protein
MKLLATRGAAMNRYWNLIRRTSTSSAILATEPYSPSWAINRHVQQRACPPTVRFGDSDIAIVG